MSAPAPPSGDAAVIVAGAPKLKFPADATWFSRPDDAEPTITGDDGDTEPGAAVGAAAALPAPRATEVATKEKPPTAEGRFDLRREGEEK